MSVLTSALAWVLGLSLLFVFFMYAVGPLLVWRLQRTPADFHFLRLKDDHLLAALSPECQALDASLRDAGFHYAGSAAMAMGHRQTYFSVYRADDGLLASLVAMKGASRTLTYVEFTWQHAEGAVTNVNNLAFSSVFPASAHKRTLRYPDIRTIPALLETARQIGHLLRQTTTIQPFTAGQEFDAIEHFLRQEAEVWVSRGWYAPAVEDGYRRLTLKGACLMTWRLLWPMRQYLRRKELREAVELRHAAGNITSQK